jgi:hypothetical protein
VLLSKSKFQHGAKFVSVWLAFAIVKRLDSAWLKCVVIKNEALFVLTWLDLVECVAAKRKRRRRFGVPRPGTTSSNLLKTIYCAFEFPDLNIQGDRKVRPEEILFLRQKKSTTFFHARISSSGKGRVSDFSATRVRVEGVGSPRVVEKVTHKAPTASGIREVEKVPFFGEYGIFFAKLAFSAVICGIRLHLHLTSI